MEIPCPSCNKTSSSKSSAKKHHGREHNEIINSIVLSTCDDCGEPSWTYYTEGGIYYEGQCNPGVHEKLDREKGVGGKA